MKKLFILSAVALSTLAMSSCSKENVTPTKADKNDVGTYQDKNDVGTYQFTGVDPNTGAPLN